MFCARSWAGGPQVRRLIDRIEELELDPTIESRLEAGAAPSTGEEQRGTARGRLARPWLICLALAVSVAAVYWPALRYDFISLDDPVYFSENPHVLGGLTTDNVKWAFTTTEDASWYPLSWLSFMLDAQLFGSGAAGPHATNVLLHVANCLLL